MATNIEFHLEKLNTIINEEQKFSKTDISKGWIDQAMYIVSHVVPEKWTASSLMQAFLQEGTIKVDKFDYSFAQIRAIVQIFTKSHRSRIISSQAKITRHSAAVPLLLAAYKINHGIPYSRWDLEDTEEKLLGRGLVGYTKACRVWEDVKDSVDLEQLRAVVASPEYNKIKHYPSLKTLIPEKFFHMMLGQTWIFEPSIRSEDMITSLEGISVVAPHIEAQTLFIAQDNKVLKDCSHALPW